MRHFNPQLLKIDNKFFVSFLQSMSCLIFCHVMALEFKIQNFILYDLDKNQHVNRC